MFFQKKRIRKHDPKDPLKIVGNRPVSEAFLESFFGIFSIEQIYFFEDLFCELEEKAEVISIDGQNFIKQAFDTYDRYKKYKNLDPFTPMDKKGQKYVEKFLRKSINLTYKNFKKQKMFDKNTIIKK